MSVIGESEEAVNGAAWAIIVVMCMFGGGMMPLAFLPKFMTVISHFSPVKWAILALEGAIWRGFTAAEMLLRCGVLLGVGITGFLVGATVLSRQDA
jgi:ABC-2 type transport system permease protein